MTSFLCFLALMVVWLLGFSAFDYVLELRGPWLMFGGAITYTVGDMVVKTIRALRQA